MKLYTKGRLGEIIDIKRIMLMYYALVFVFVSYLESNQIMDPENAFGSAMLHTSNRVNQISISVAQTSSRTIAIQCNTYKISSRINAQNKSFIGDPFMDTGLQMTSESNISNILTLANTEKRTLLVSNLVFESIKPSIVISVQGVTTDAAIVFDNLVIRNTNLVNQFPLITVSGLVGRVLFTRCVLENAGGGPILQMLNSASSSASIIFSQCTVKSMTGPLITSGVMPASKIDVVHCALMTSSFLTVSGSVIDSSGRHQVRFSCKEPDYYDLMRNSMRDMMRLPAGTFASSVTDLTKGGNLSGVYFLDGGSVWTTIPQTQTVAENSKCIIIGRGPTVTTISLSDVSSLVRNIFEVREGATLVLAHLTLNTDNGASTGIASINGSVHLINCHFSGFSNSVLDFTGSPTDGNDILMSSIVVERSVFKRTFVQNPNVGISPHIKISCTNTSVPVYVDIRESIIKNFYNYAIDLSRVRLCRITDNIIGNDRTSAVKKTACMVANSCEYSIITGNCFSNASVGILSDSFDSMNKVIEENTFAGVQRMVDTHLTYNGNTDSTAIDNNTMYDYFASST